MRWLRPAILMFIIITLAGAFSKIRADEINSTQQNDKKRLERYNDRVNNQKSKLLKIKGKERSILDDMAGIEEEIARKEHELSSLNNKKNGLESEISALEAQAEEIVEKIHTQRAQLQKRCVTLYKFSNMQYLRVLFSAGSYSDILKRYKYLKLILNQDSDLISQYGNDKNKLELKSKIIKKEKEILDEIIKKVENKEREIVAEKNSKELLLLKVKREKNYHLRMVKELEKAAKKLEGLVYKLQGAGGGKSGKEKFADFKGILEAPVEGEITSYYGEERNSQFNSSLFNNGIKISADTGKDVKSVFSGKVAYSDWFRGYGKLIIVEHGDGYFTVYAHLSELKKKSGDFVKRGEVIAKSGDTGSLSGSRLYFEVRNVGRAVDPLDWLEPILYDKIDVSVK